MFCRIVKYSQITLILLTFLSPLFFSCKTANLEVKNEQIAPWLKPGLLNSTRIETKFGSFGVAVLEQDPLKNYRLSNLYSLDNNNIKISRTIALTQYRKKMPKELKAAHEEIIAGASIGATLKKHGFELIKDIFYVGNEKNMPSQMHTLMHSTENSFASIIYNLSAKRENKIYGYCIIAEVYSPDYLTMQDLNQILRSESLGDIKEKVVKEAPRKKVEAIFHQLRALLKNL